MSIRLAIPRGGTWTGEACEVGGDEAGSWDRLCSQVSDLAQRVPHIPDVHPGPLASSRETHTVCEGQPVGQHADHPSWVSHSVGSLF